jgi:hypothetical protein
MTFDLRVTDETHTPHNLAPLAVKEALVDETISLSAEGGYITALTAYDVEADCELTGSSFVAHSPGLYRLRCVASNGVRELLIRVVERSVLEAIPDYGFRTGYGQSASPRMALRSICNTGPANWAGTADWFFDNRIKLGNHGVNAPQNP